MCVIMGTCDRLSAAYYADTHFLQRTLYPAIAAYCPPAQQTWMKPAPRRFSVVPTSSGNQRRVVLASCQPRSCSQRCVVSASRKSISEHPQCCADSQRPPASRQPPSGNQSAATSRFGIRRHRTLSAHLRSSSSLSPGWNSFAATIFTTPGTSGLILSGVFAISLPPDVANSASFFPVKS